MHNDTRGGGGAQAPFFKIWTHPWRFTATLYNGIEVVYAQCKCAHLPTDHGGRKQSVSFLHAQTNTANLRLGLKSSLLWEGYTEFESKIVHALI